MPQKKPRLSIPTDSLDERRISLSSNQEDKALVEGLISYFIGVVGTVIPIIGILAEWNNKREDIKRAEVLKRLKINIAKQGVQIANITNLLKNPKGRILFNKILFLARLSEPEDDDFGSFADLLGDVLVNLSTKDFESLFDKISYLISRIEKLTKR